LWHTIQPDLSLLIGRLSLLRRWQWTLQIVVTSGIVFFIGIAPFTVSLSLTLNNVQNGFPTAIDPFLIRADDAIRVAQFVNTHANSDDLVIASSAMAWQLQTRTADFQMASVATGQATPHFPDDLPASRFVYDPRLENARYVVIDDLWRNWAAVN